MILDKFRRNLRERCFLAKGKGKMLICWSADSLIGDGEMLIGKCWLGDADYDSRMLQQNVTI